MPSVIRAHVIFYRKNMECELRGFRKLLHKPDVADDNNISRQFQWKKYLQIFRAGSLICSDHGLGLRGAVEWVFLDRWVWHKFFYSCFFCFQMCGNYETSQVVKTHTSYTSLTHMSRIAWFRLLLTQIVSAVVDIRKSWNLIRVHLTELYYHYAIKLASNENAVQ